MQLTETPRAKKMGRPAGVPNKATINARLAIARFVDRNAFRLENWLEKIAKESPKQAFDCYMSVVEYHIPKLQRSEVDMNVKNDLESAPTSTINIILNSLRAMRDVTPESQIAQDSASPIGLSGEQSEPDRLITYQAASLIDNNACLLDNKSERSDSTTLPQSKEMSGVVVGVDPAIDREMGTLFPEKNERPTNDGITGVRKARRGRPPKNTGGSVIERAGSADSPVGTTDQVPKIRDISALL
jgi:hypothetical protein